MVEVKRKKLLKKAFFLSLLCHIAFFSLFITLSLPLFKKSDIVPQVIEITNADYVPFPEKEKPVDKEEEAKKEEERPISKNENVIKKEEQKSSPKEEGDFKIPERKRPDFSWKKDVEKKLPQENLNKITVSNLQRDSTKDALINAKNAPVPSVPLAYARMLGFLIRSHWYVPEDLGHKFYGLSAELEVTIDAFGNIKNVVVTRSSGNGSFDFYAKEAVLKTGKFPLPPKETFATIFLDDKIRVEFKP
ncbi:MAG: hypothetical protein OHK0040_11140 [bacterium]